MKKWLIYVLGVITGVILTIIFAFCVSLSDRSKANGLEMFDKPGDYMDYSEFRVIQVAESGGALAEADNTFEAIVFIVPNETEHFYDGQIIKLSDFQCPQRVGTFKYEAKIGIEKTVPAIKIVDRPQSLSPNNISDKNDPNKTFFKEPGECVSRKDFEIKEVLESGDAIALEITDVISGHVFTSDLEVLIPAKDGNEFYNNQIVKTSKGKCARQIGTYKYQEYGKTKVIPIVTFD